jgi:hypothetical protein
MLGVKMGRPKVDSNGMSTTQIYFSAKIVQDRNIDTRAMRRYIPAWAIMSKEEAKEYFSERRLLDIAFDTARTTARGMGERHWMNVTHIFTKEITVMTQCLFINYLCAMTRGDAITEVVVNKANKGLAHELKSEIFRSLAAKGLIQSRLAETVDVHPLKADDLDQRKGTGWRFKVNLGVELKMYSYGWIRDTLRGPTGGGKHVPYQAIMDWIEYYNIVPNDPLMTKERLASLICRKIDKHGYEGNNFLLEALGAVATRNIAGYYVWSSLGNLDKECSKMIPKLKAMTAGYAKSIDVPDGKYTVSTT